MQRNLRPYLMFLADKMVPTEERGVRRAIAFSELLQHQHLVKCMGQWEADDIIYVGGQLKWLFIVVQQLYSMTISYSSRRDN